MRTPPAKAQAHCLVRSKDLDGLVPGITADVQLAALVKTVAARTSFSVADLPGA
jgi:hypothetical protein